MPGVDTSSHFTNSALIERLSRRFRAFQAPCALSLKPILISWFWRRARIHPAGAIKTRFRSSSKPARDISPGTSRLPLFWISRLPGPCSPFSVDAPGLSDLLQTAKSRADLTAKQRDAMEEIFSTWSVRRAQRAYETDPQMAFSILVQAGSEYPADRNIHATLASFYLQQHDKQRALDVFQTWGMTETRAGDFRMAAGAALSAHKSDLADQFLRRAGTLSP